MWFDLCFLCLQGLGHSVGSYQRYAFVAESVGVSPPPPPPPPRNQICTQIITISLYSFIHSLLNMFQ